MRFERAMGVLTIASLLAACASGNDEANHATSSAPPSTASSTSETAATVPDKSGASPAAPLTIHLAAENDSDSAESDGLYEFARRVEEMSDGQIAVDIQWQTNTLPEVWDANPGPIPTTHDVVTGAFDMGFASNGYWAYEGVETTRPANAPLLIRSAEQAVAIAEDPDLVSDLFAGLDDVGVVGLQMYPQNFKVLVDFAGPVTTPDDLAGLVLRSRAAPELFDFYAALGVAPQQDNVGNELYVAPPWIAEEWQPGVAVGNLPIYFAYFDLYANKAFWRALTDDQRDIISQAALRGRDFVSNHLPEDGSADAMSSYCDRGGTVTWLDGDGLAAFEAAAGPVVAQLRADPAKADLLDRIDALGADKEPTIYAACDGSPTDDASASPTALPDGVYRLEITNEDLERAGIPKDQWEADAGVFTYTLTNGRFTWTQQSPTAPELDSTEGSYEGNGTYAMAGQRVTFTDLSFGDPISFTVAPTVGDDGSLTWKIVDADRNFVRFLFGEPWVRIGDA